MLISYPMKCLLPVFIFVCVSKTICHLTMHFVNHGDTLRTIVSCVVHYDPADCCVTANAVTETTKAPESSLYRGYV